MRRKESFVNGDVDVDGPYFGEKQKGMRDRRAAGKVPVFGILERQGRVFVGVVPTTRVKDVIAPTIEKICSDRYSVYDVLFSVVTDTFAWTKGNISPSVACTSMARKDSEATPRNTS